MKKMITRAIIWQLKVYTFSSNFNLVIPLCFFRDDYVWRVRLDMPYEGAFFFHGKMERVFSSVLLTGKMLSGCSILYIFLRRFSPDTSRARWSRDSRDYFHSPKKRLVSIRTKTLLYYGIISTEKFCHIFLCLILIWWIIRYKFEV